MKELIVLNSMLNAEYSCRPLGDVCSIDCSLLWALNLIKSNPKNSIQILILCKDKESTDFYSNHYDEIKNQTGNKIFDGCKENFDSIRVLNAGKAKSMGSFMALLVEQSQGFDTVIYGFSDCPFYNLELTQKILKLHYESGAEYTFADGYAQGLSPEVIHTGTVRILNELCSQDSKKADMPLARNSIFELLKTDINSFEIETVISDRDYRGNRLCFDTRNRNNFELCKKLLALYQGKTEFPIFEPIETLSGFILNNPELLFGLPAFYNIQIAEKCSGKCPFCAYPVFYKKEFGTFPENSDKFMGYEDFCKLIENISEFSSEAVVSLSLWGEAVNHPQLSDFIAAVLAKPGLSVLIELSGVKFPKEKIKEISDIVSASLKRTGDWDKIYWILSFDSVSSQNYNEIHCLPQGSAESYENLMESYENLKVFFPDSVYPQFLRMNENEEHLEEFYRFWNEKNNGKLIIQKYDEFAGILPEKKPADLSPVIRNACWHLLRDFTILLDGSVPLCRSFFKGSEGNVFKESLEQIWNKRRDKVYAQLSQDYSGMCGKCDEYYTFNF